MFRNVEDGTREAPRRHRDSQVQFREFDLVDEAEVVRLLSVGRPEAYGPLKAKVFEWQFLKNPHSDGSSPFLVGELDGRIIALNGFMPARLRFHGRPIEACWSCDTYVSVEHRGKGIGKQLIAQVTHAAPLMLGYGISDMSDPIFETFGWKLHRGLDVVFFHLAERGMKGRIKNAVSRIAAVRGPRIHGSEYETWDALTPNAIAELDEMWHRHADGYVSAIHRDAAYLRWKYFEHPVYRYRAYAQRTRGRLHAVMIVRHDPEESVIADYSGPAQDEDAIASLASQVIRDHGDRETARIKCESTHQPLVRALRKVGFISSSYPSRFRVRWNTGESDPLRGWFLMPGDSDGDLLASSSYEAQGCARVPEVSGGTAS
jgi:GNAT superfamily N-acetyltransferase